MNKTGSAAIAEKSSVAWIVCQKNCDFELYDWIFGRDKATHEKQQTFKFKRVLLTKIINNWVEKFFFLKKKQVQVREPDLVIGEGSVRKRKK